MIDGPRLKRAWTAAGDAAMQTIHYRCTTLLAALGALLLGASNAEAQAFPGFVNLPANNFVWIWGRRDEALTRRSSDFAVSGNEAGFRCDLTVKQHPASRLTRADQRQLENNLRTSLAFIQDAANTMSILEQRREIDWAVLDCKKPTDEDLTEAERQERVDRALERARAEQQRRRAREQSN